MACLLCCGIALPRPASAHDEELRPSDSSTTAAPEDEVVVEATRSQHWSASSSRVSMEALRLRPRRRPADLLDSTAGLFAVQHSGGGKATQYFLRGFDIDHGTDLLLLVDGVPVNMPSHGHGQGYSDLHFLIPETLAALSVYKGPYLARFGDFATAGAAEFTVSHNPDSQASGSVGLYGERRGLGLLSRDLNNQSHVVAAAEIYAQDGPFQNAEDLIRFNTFGRLDHELSATSSLSLTWMGYSGRWNASGQIPVREVRAGRLDPFGSLDPSEGGASQRHSLSLGYNSESDNLKFHARLYAVRSRFGLYSNFTFFLEDAENGDQIEQADAREVLGGNLSANFEHHLGALNWRTEVGFQVRNDTIRNSLYRTVRRRRLSNSVNAEIAQSSLGAYVEEQVSPLRWLHVRTGLRLDRLDVAVNDLAAPLPESPATSGTAGSFLASPKFSLALLPVRGLEVFFNWGRGFHSNDARGATRQAGRTPLAVPATSYEVGTRFTLLRPLTFNTTAYRIELDSEQVYVGDAGTTEPSAATSRLGLELSLEARLDPWLTFDGSFTANRGRFRDVPSSQNFIPLAPTRTATAGLAARLPWGSFGSLRLRHLSSRPATEDASIEAEGWTIVSASIGHRRGPLELSLAVDNLLGERWREVQFATESQLRGEDQGVEEIHFAPGWPRTVQATLRAFFE